MILQKQILVVEDNAINRELLKEILSGQYSVLEAANGKEALELLRSYKEDVALVLLDVMMPVMDGYTLLDVIKSDSELSLIPVIVTTQSNSEEDEINALSHGAPDFVPKPYKPQVMLHRIASIINLRETAAMVNQFQYDPLTRLQNKEFFYRKVEETLRQYPTGTYALICSDVENFKLYNDLFGMAAGDELLKQIAVQLNEMVGGKGICGRQGADRFMCLSENAGICSVAKLGKFTEELNQAVGGHVVIKWGIYEIKDRNVSVEQMCDRAFLAAERIKGQYKKNVSLYDDLD